MSMKPVAQKSAFADKKKYITLTTNEVTRIASEMIHNNTFPGLSEEGCRDLLEALAVFEILCMEHDKAKMAKYVNMPADEKVGFEEPKPNQAVTYFHEAARRTVVEWHASYMTTQKYKRAKVDQGQADPLPNE